MNRLADHDYLLYGYFFLLLSFGQTTIWRPKAHKSFGKIYQFTVVGPGVFYVVRIFAKPKTQTKWTFEVEADKNCSCREKFEIIDPEKSSSICDKISKFYRLLTPTFTSFCAFGLIFGFRPAHSFFAFVFLANRLWKTLQTDLRSSRQLLYAVGIRGLK